MFCTHRVHIQNNSMQAKGLQHAPDSKLWQCCPSCGAIGIVTVWAADDHSKACVEKEKYCMGQLIWPINDLNATF